MPFAAGLDFVLAGQHASPPAYPYGTFQWLTGPVFGFLDANDSRWDAEEEVFIYNATNVGQATLRVTIISDVADYTNGARALMENLCGILSLPSAADALAAAGASVARRPTILDQADFLSNRVYTKAIMDIAINIPTLASEEISFIETVDLAGEIVDNADTIEIEFTTP